MKNNLLPLVLVITALFLYSCDSPVNNDNGAVSGHFPTVQTPRTFWAVDTTDESFYQVNAKLLYEGVNCTIWAETSANVAPNSAQKISNAYDQIVYPKMMNSFGSNDLQAGDGIKRNTMQLADYYGDGDGKLCILLLKIKDDYYYGNSNAYVAGYFFSGNYYPDETDDWRSNECDMIYIDVKVNQPGSDNSNCTVAHEMQHMMNFVSSEVERSGALMDTWIDEGLSSAAECVVSGKQNQSRVDWYMGDWNNSSDEGLIAYGNNFFVWGNYVSQYPGAILDDYATVYLFFQWLRLQAGNTGIYRDILNSPSSDLTAVTTAADTYMPGGNDNNQRYNNWGTLLKTWLASNMINASGGSYGYRNDPVLRKIVSYRLENSGPYPLAPGEGIYTAAKTMPAITPNIQYAGIRNTAPAAVSDTSVDGCNLLLSYNVDTNNNSDDWDFSYCDPFDMEITGPQQAQADVLLNQDSRSLSQQPRSSFTGPYPISAGDMLRRHGYKETLPGLDYSKFGKAAKIVE